MERENPVGPVVVHSADTTEYADGEFCDLVNVGIGDGGIPDAEWEITKTEAPLRHTDSIGLRVTDWRATAPGCSVDMSSNQPRGSVLTVRVPAETASAERSGSRGPAE